MLVQLRAPNGKRIIGTLDVVTGRANLIGFRRGPDGNLEPEYTGETTVWWDEQHTVQREGSDVLVDEDGEEWLARDCAMEEEGEEGGAR